MKMIKHKKRETREIYGKFPLNFLIFKKTKDYEQRKGETILRPRAQHEGSAENVFSDKGHLGPQREQAARKGG